MFVLQWSKKEVRVVGNLKILPVCLSTSNQNHFSSEELKCMCVNGGKSV